MATLLKLWCLFLSGLNLLEFTLVHSQQYNCSRGIIPTLDGAWLCDHSWADNEANDNAYELQHISDGNYDTFVNKRIGEDNPWSIIFKVPKYFAISKIMISGGCVNSVSHNAYFSIDVWDEYQDYNSESHNIKTNWINVQSDVIIPIEYEVFDGFSIRSPYWRISFHGNGEICLREIEFFVKAGIAALYDEHGYTLQTSVDILNSPSQNRQLAPTSNTCHQVVSPVPSRVVSKYKLDTSFYAKYTSAYGIPIMSSRVVDDRALQRACYVVRFMLAHRSEIRSHMYNNKGRVAIIGRRERVPNVPEMRQFYWFTRRAAGGTYQIPVNVGAEENMLCEAADGYAKNQDIFMHEFAHGIHLIAAYTAIPNFNSRLQKSLTSARSRGLWRNTYANTDNREYFAEGVQAYFNQQRKGPRGGDGIQNDISTREKLKNYDRTLYNLVHEIFPCTSMSYIPRCDDIYQRKGLSKKIHLNCGDDGDDGKETGGGGGKGSSCKDSHKHCKYWSENGECDKARKYMKKHCEKSCKFCSGTGSTCMDNNKYCSTWANTYCSSNSYVKSNCKKSCRAC